jgi:hypothetical protein
MRFPATITLHADGRYTLTEAAGPVTPPPSPPPNLPHGNRDQAIIAQVHKLRSEGSRGNVLAAMFLEYARAGSRLEPVLSKQIPNYRQWLDWRSFGGENHPIPVPSGEWERMLSMLRALPA